MSEGTALWGFNAYYNKLDVNIKNIFVEPVVFEETVFFIDRGETKRLLFLADSIVKVTSYDRKIVYEEGRDYRLVDGKLHIPENSSIPCITTEKYYNVSDSIVSICHNGSQVPVYWGEDNTMTQWQIRVTYTHSDSFDGFVQPDNSRAYEKFIGKLISGEDVTVIAYGDSITCGATSSWYCGLEPHIYTYSMQFACALADVFGYTVKFVDASELHPQIKKPPCDYVGGDRGTIMYINTSVGGWRSITGVENYDRHVAPFVEKHGCDLFICAFGMNDSAYTPQTPAENAKIMIDKTLALSADASIALISTMVPNPISVGWYANQRYQEPHLMDLAQQYREDGIPCEVVQMTSVSQAVLKYKEFVDCSGNNINHPNDFFIRIYANALLQSVIGYGNLK